MTIHRPIDAEEDRAERLQSLSVIPDFDDLDEDDAAEDPSVVAVTPDILKRSPLLTTSK
jgi:hypothetical protein